MKKLFQFILFIGLGALLFWGGSMIINRDHHQGELTRLQQDQITASQANYLPVEPFNGPDFTTAAEKTVHGVVNIQSEFTRKSSNYDDFFAPFRDIFGPYGDQTYTGIGSGVIISDDGYILTNNHVVEGASKITVTLNDKRSFEAGIIGRDPNTDLALIKIDATGLPFIPFGNSDDVKIGEWVLAVGNPFNLTSTVTAGIVSAKARNINILGTPGAIESFIQTDAAVNRGNSGGALVNMNGELVGINAAIASNTGSYAGYSFAIPVNIAKKVVNDILSYGQVQRAYLGVVIREVDADLAKEKGLDVYSGVYVQSLAENGGAEAAGLEPGDVIVKIDGTPVNGTSALLENIGQRNPGDKVLVTVDRSGKMKDYEVELKNESGTIAVTRADDDFFMSELGATFEPVSKKEAESLGLDYGMKVTGLDDGMLKKGGVQEGFIIQDINGYEIHSKEDIESALQNLSRGVIRISGIYPNGMRMNYGFIL